MNYQSNYFSRLSKDDCKANVDAVLWHFFTQCWKENFFLSLSAWLSVCLLACLSVDLFVWGLFIDLPASLTVGICLSARSSASSIAWLSVCTSVRLYVCLPGSLRLDLLTIISHFFSSSYIFFVLILKPILAFHLFQYYFYLFYSCSIIFLPIFLLLHLILQSLIPF